MITRTKEKFSRDEETGRVVESQESGIECKDEYGPFTTN